MAVTIFLSMLQNDDLKIYESFNTRQLNTNRIEELPNSSGCHDLSWAELIGNQWAQVHHCPQTNERQSRVQTVLY